MDTAVVLTEHEQNLQTPHQETEFANVAAKQLMDIVRQNGWARKFGGQSEHLQVEAWLTVGKYYGLSVDTDQQEVEYVDYGGVWGFKAHAQVIDTKTGMRVGGASALCMSDEANWKSKPKFQLASMAQTRATSKALRQMLSFVVALAGFSPTPLEEMTTPQSGKDPEWIADDKNSPLDRCVECDKPLTAKVADWSESHYGKLLCMDHQPKK